MLEGLALGASLEVGCNRGHNLPAVRNVVGPDCAIAAVEPNAYARRLAAALDKDFCVTDGSVCALPYGDGHFDLVFTVGVLIHVPLTDLSAALAEIYRVSARHVLFVEYFAETETEIEYRGHTGALWKRNFLQHCQTNHPDLCLLRSGYWTPEDGFDRTHWWLLEKVRFEGIGSQ